MKKNAFILVALGAAALLIVAVLMKNFNAPPAPMTGSACLDCHRSPNIATNEGVMASNAFCLGCHSEAALSIGTIGDDTLSLMVGTDQLPTGPHARIACVQCHTDVARSPHKATDTADCMGCHPAHGEKTAHSPHLRVDCQACHGNSPFVRLDPKDARVKLARIDDTGAAVALTDHALSDTGNEELCLRCHHKGNTVGAPAAVLPAKSVLCMVCHTASLTVGHPIFGIALLVLIAGVLLTLRFWFLGSVKGEEKSLHRKIALASESVWATVFSRKFFSLAKIFFFDILLQRRILKDSVQRWSMHSLIYTAILVRFLLSVFTATLFNLAPQSGLAMALMDKNNAFVAFSNDLFGLFILFGITWAIVQRFVVKPAHVVTEIEDNITVGLLGLLILLGFFLEGARIVLTQIPTEVAAYSFVAYPLARGLARIGVDWTSIYPALWYAHAAVGALFVAYLPFGKLRHIFNVPLTYFLEDVDGVKREQRV